MKAIIGKKVGMSQIFDENGRVIPVTVIEAGPCTVVQKKTSEKEGYNAVQLGYEDIAERKLTKGEMKKVVWPSKQDVKTNTIVVLVTVAIAAVVMILLDAIFGGILGLIIGA